MLGWRAKCATEGRLALLELLPDDDAAGEDAPVPAVGQVVSDAASETASSCSSGSSSSSDEDASSAELRPR